MKSLHRRLIPSLILILSGCHPTGQDGRLTDENDSHIPDTSVIHASIRNAIAQLRRDPAGVTGKLDTALSQSAAAGYVEGMAETYWLMGQAYFYQYRYYSALAMYDLSYDAFSSQDIRSGMAKVLLGKSYAFTALQKLQQSLDCAEDSRRIFEDLQDYDMAYRCIEGLIYIYKQLNNTSAVDSLVNSLTALAEKTGNERNLASSYIAVGNNYLDKAYLNLAIEAYYKALSLAEASGDSIVTAYALGNIGLSNLTLHEYRLAIDYYLKQEKILQELNDLYELRITYTGLGEAYNSLKEYGRGLEYHLKSLELSSMMDFQPAISNSLYNIGYTYYLMGKSSTLALDYLQQAIHINQEISNFNKLVDNYLLSGLIHLSGKDSMKANASLEQAMKLALQYNNPQVVLEASGWLSRLYASSGNYDKAYENLLINNSIADSLNNGENLKRITQLDMQRRFDQEQNETEMLHMQETLQLEHKLKKNRLLRNYIAAAGSLFIMLGAFLYHSYRKSVKAEKEKEALLKEIHHRVKNNLMVVSSLLNLQSGAISDVQSRNAMRESQNRVRSMALIHELLYQTELFTGIDFSAYLEQLMSSLQQTYGKPGRDVRYAIKAERIKLDIDAAVPLGLITNELVTNAYKYAFPDDSQGHIDISLSKGYDHQYELLISDNGRGLPEGFDPEQSGTLGLKLVRILTRQMKATMSCRSDNGTRYAIKFTAGTLNT